MQTPNPQPLSRTSPEQQGIASSAILEWVQAIEHDIHELHSFMLLRRGCVVAEGWWSPYAPEYPHMLFSLSKSFTSTAVGFAVTEGYLSVDDPVISFFPEFTPETVSDFLAEMQVRHLLSMSTGHAVDTWGIMVNQSGENWVQSFLNVPVVHPPGTHFLYNTGATYMLSAIVQKTTGMKLIDYLQPRLFETLGIENAHWVDSPQGINAGGIGLSLTTADVAKFGQFYLQKGRWQGQQRLPQAWIAEATSSHISNGDDPDSDWAQGYGYQFWRCRHNIYRGDGAFGQYCIVMPEQDAVLVMTGGVGVFDMQQPLDLVWDKLLPAMQPQPLPEDPTAHAKLREKLSSLMLPPVEGATHTPFTTQVSAQTYAVDDNSLDIKTITFNFADDDCEIRVKTGEGEQTIRCGYGTWRRSHISLFKQAMGFDEAWVSTSGAWTTDDTLTLIIRLDETPFFYTMTCYFSDRDLMIDIQINASLDSTEPILLTASPEMG